MITEKDIKEIFEDVKVGKEQAVVYDKYRREKDEIARELTDFIRTKKSNPRSLGLGTEVSPLQRPSARILA